MANETAVSLEGVCFAYDSRDVISDVSLTIPNARVTALVGANGSGKSTLLELIAGVLAPRDGTIDWSIDPRIALVVQRAMIAESLPVTVRDVVTMGRWARLGPWRRVRAVDRTAVDDALDRVGMRDLASRPITSVSGGQRQRAFLAQGLVQDASVLLLDEPATGLDAESRERVRDILDEQARAGVTVICVTHEHDAIASATNVVRLDAGRVATLAR